MNNEGVMKILIQLPQTSYGEALKLFLEEELRAIDSVDSVVTLSEIKGKQLAKKTIKRIFAFYPVGTFDKKPKNKYS